jgi:hypothetical protein
MSQHGLSDYDPTARTGTDLQAIFDAFQSGHIGTSRPSYATKGTIWLKEIGDPFTSIQEYLYDGSGDRLLREYFATGRIRTYFSNDGDQWIEADPSGNDLIIGAGNSARFQFTNDGDLIPETDDASDIGSASKRINQIFTSGGIYLGGTATANFLKNYNISTWSLADASGGVTLSTVGYARYERIGSSVFVEFDITYPTNSNNLTSRINLPVAAQSYASGMVGWSDTSMPVKIHIGVAGLYFVDCGNPATGNTHLQNSQLSGKRLIGSARYLAA